MPNKSFLSKHSGSYSKYIVIGGIVGVITVLIREGISFVLPQDTPTYYAVSVVLAYCVGILLSYYGHRKVSFSHAQPVGSTVESFSRFTVIAIMGLLATTGLSVLLRYKLPFDKYLSDFGAATAFAIATFLASLLTYSLNATFTFSSKNQ